MASVRSEPDLHEGAGHQLEILDHAAGEDDALHRIVGIDEDTGVADAVKSFFVERRPGQLRLADNSPA